MDWCVLRLESDVRAEERSAWVRVCCGDVRAVVLKNEDGAWGRIVGGAAALEDLTGDERVRGRCAWVCDDVDVTSDVTTMHVKR